MNPRVSRSYVLACSSLLFSCSFAFILQVFFFSPIAPDPLHLPPALLAPGFPTNDELQRVIKIGEGFLKDPEDVCVDKEGILYTATRDGWIKRLHKNGSWEDWKMIGGPNLLGITTSMTGDLLVCDTDKGLLKVGEGGVEVLATHVNCSKISFADDVIEASDGSVYFSDVSTKFGLHDWYLDVLEAKPHGRLLKYDPSTNQTSIVLDNLCFPNGVALSKDQDFLVVCETWKFRCLKYWLKGEMKGKMEVFIDNLPGAPDNINLAPDGSFWIALLQLTSNGLEFVHTSKAAKHLVATFPKLIEKVKGMHKKAMVVKVAANGKIIIKFDDPNGTVMSFVTSVLEFEEHLYLGSLNSNFIGKLQLKTPFFADDVIEASDGSVYFSDVSTKFGLHDWYLDVLEAKPHGRLLKYDPSTYQTSIVLDDLCFPNGVALSEDQDFLVVGETWKFRCLKYWLRGEMEGKTEVFIDNLPGAPDNINLAPDGSFWIALVQLTSNGLEFVHTSKAAKHLVATFPKPIEIVKGMHKKAMFVKVAANGKIIIKFKDPNGTVMSFVTSVLEFEEHLYLGSLNSNFIGKLQLKTPMSQ
ncbi:hypothetical protein HHK36_025394 [Tetracentron sinense]|uniref:Strictosidine synthase conserved region domain-containing protein n=1 Tax=Tetracentron sinense TaxID=13715 RepID=A0A835D6C4_TETSI|nr:hypothetical protein HHK36_025394 [Tetracentron sinense]